MPKRFRPMTITIPLFALRHGQISGAESAIFNLMRGLKAENAGLRVAYSRPDYLAPAIREWIEANHIPSQRYPHFGAAMSARFAEETVFSLVAKADRVLFPNYHLPVGGLRIGQRSVIIHDLQHKVFPQYFGGKKVAWLDLQFRRTLAKADRILFISQFELGQAKRHYGSRFEDRAAVVYNAIDWKRFEGPISEAAAIRGKQQFILSVAHQYPHKRLSLLIRAFGLLAGRHEDLLLLLVGRPTPQLIEMARDELPPEVAKRVHFTGFISDADLGFLYRHARAFALPSLYEGFGMPAVEALGFGGPALLTDAAAVKEVTMGYGTYLPPSDGSPEWAEALEHMLGAPKASDEAAALALRRRFDPSRIARELQSALDGRGASEGARVPAT